MSRKTSIRVCIRYKVYGMVYEVWYIQYSRTFFSHEGSGTSCTVLILWEFKVYSPRLFRSRLSNP